ncbi:alpha-2-macroglobulin family protein [Vineibacter terrae]|uniref:Alpha-2-macroglobulin family protein n=1 Tax=Vineibacter terrae TaxID=2586908 RepID=A0A5C8P9G0_9HYPH|nr:alpha-2-macroglobulin family protein [Vineibacter terrae]
MPFRFGRVTLSADATPEACLHFSELLDDSGRVKYGDYLAIQPQAQPAIVVRQERICLGGLAYGANYQVELKAGLPAKSGAKLAAAETVDVALGERPASVNFQSKGYILPRETAGGVPLTTVNVSKVYVQIYRISDRMVSQVGRSASIFYSDDDEAFGESRRELQSYAMDAFRKKTGALLWSGTMEVRNDQNKVVTTSIPVREVVKDWKPGAYVVVAWNAADGTIDELLGKENENFDYDKYYERRFATQWLIDTDIGLTTFTGSDGLTVFARSLNTAQPAAGIELTLITRNNEDIARLTTDAQGRAQFPANLLATKGAGEPIMVMARDKGGSNFSYIDVQKGAFDLSDRGVEGRSVPGPVDAFLYTDRGVFRPGETVNIVALIRDRAANAIEGVPVTMVAKRPDGVEYRRAALQMQGAGGLHWPLELTRTARRGKWSVETYLDPKGAPVGRVEFAVEDFIPQKIKVELSGPKAPVGRNAELAVDVGADFLYGAPAAGLDGEGELTVKVDPAPFPALPGYLFGDPDAKFGPEVVRLDLPTLDDKGKSQATTQLDEKIDHIAPLLAEARISVFEPGGRPTAETLTVPIRTRNGYVGVRPALGDRELPPWYGQKDFSFFVPEGHEAAFEIAAVDAAGKRIARSGLQWRIERIHRTYQWFQDQDGRWRWQDNDRAVVVTEGTIDVAADRSTRVAGTFEWGRHRLVVVDAENDTRTVVKFYVGWGASSDERDSPDTAGVVADKKAYAVGETARLRIEAPFAGEAMVVLASDRIFETRMVKVAAGGSTVDIPVSADWGAGAYALVTAYRPLQQKADRVPVRTVGLAWLAIDPGARRLDVQIGTPESIVPRQRVVMPVKVANAGSGEVFVTLAAVDEGILQITRHKTPAPVDYYFGKRMLGVAMRDDYGKLLDPRADFMGQLRSGGDGAGGAGLDAVPIKIASLFSGVVKLDANGEARIALDVPDFSGQLRLMVVAYDKARVGAAEKRLFVRDAVTSDLVLPRFLAPGDDSRATISVQNVTGAPGDYKVRLTAVGPVNVTAGEKTVSLPANKREQLSVPIVARETGISTLTLAMEGPGGFKVTRDWQIEVRPTQAPVTKQFAVSLTAGKELTVDREAAADFLPGTASVAVAVSALRGFDVASILRSLDRYPYGCLEQTTSRALPLLYFNDVALLGAQHEDRAIARRVQDAVFSVLDRQASDGGFGMWTAQGSIADPWLQVYALDFLMRAREKGFVVPETPYRRGLLWLQRSAEKMAPNAQAYAWYVLARAGLADAGRVRYFQDTDGDKIVGALGRGQLAAALTLVGERGRSQGQFQLAVASVGQKPKDDYYGTAVRDLAGLIALVPDADQRPALARLTTLLLEQKRLEDRYTTTQEKAWMLMAAYATLQGAGGKLDLVVDGKPVKPERDPAAFDVDVKAGKKLSVKNAAAGEVWATVSVRGVPTQVLPPEQHKGLQLSRQFLTLDGKPADLSKVRQNDRLIALVSVGNVNQVYREIALLDLLPAGLEIEGVLPEENAYKFLPALSKVSTTEARDDRFFASFTLGKRPVGSAYRFWYNEDDRSAVQLAYIVRAVTPGTYALPAVQAEDMYDPETVARGAPGKLTVLPR